MKYITISCILLYIYIYIYIYICNNDYINTLLLITTYDTYVSF